MPRVTLAAGYEVGLPMALTIEVLDISLSGVLLSSKAALEVPRRGRLRLPLDSFAADVEIRRVEPRESDVRFGASFVGLDETSRQRLAEFLRRANA